MVQSPAEAAVAKKQRRPQVRELKTVLERHITHSLKISLVFSEKFVATVFSVQANLYKVYRQLHVEQNPSIISLSAENSTKKNIAYTNDIIQSRALRQPREIHFKYGETHSNTRDIRARRTIIVDQSQELSRYFGEAIGELIGEGIGVVLRELIGEVLGEDINNTAEDDL